VGQALAQRPRFLPKLIQVGRVPWTDEPAVARVGGRLVDKHPGESSAKHFQFRRREAPADRGEPRGSGSPERLLRERPRDARNRLQGTEKEEEVLRAQPSTTQLPDQPLEVVNPHHRLAEFVADQRCARQRLHRVQSLLDCPPIRQRREDKATEAPAPHPCHGVVERVEERALLLALPHGADELEAADGERVQIHVIGDPVGAHGTQVRWGRLLGSLDVRRDGGRGLERELVDSLVLHAGRSNRERGVGDPGHESAVQQGGERR